jgi:hypothetical protein
MAEVFDFGAPATLGIEIRDSTRTLANATAVSCTVTLPDGTTTSLSVTNTATGVYSATYASPPTVGDYLAYWVATGTNADTMYRGFTVSGPPLFELDELDSFLGLTADASRAELCRQVAQGLVRADLRQSVTRATYAASLPIIAGPDGFWRVPLLERPVSAVSSVVVTGDTYVLGTDYTWDGVSPWLRLADRTFSTDPFRDIPRATVTYTGGYLVAPAVIRGVALSVAGRAYSNPAGLRSESIDDYSFTRAGSDDDLAGVSLTATERRALAPYRIVAGSLVLS